MRRDHTRSGLARLLAGLMAFGLVLAGATWAAGQRDGSARDKGKPPTPPAARPNDPSSPLAAGITSSEIDRLLDKELQQAGVELSPITQDADFLRRVYIDLTGRPPTADKLDDFVKSSDPAKRSKVIDSLLSTDDYARNWARYWRDVIRYHAVEARSTPSAPDFENWMVGQIKENVPWDKIAIELIIATGETDDEGRTYPIFAQADMENTPVNVAAEMTRVFMGIQIQCAQCHDHPYDQWKREQFHAMSAFFARTVVRPIRDKGPRSFEVTSKDKLRPEFARAFMADGKLPENIPPEKRAELAERLKQLTPEKRAALQKRGGRAALEHFITDKDDPEKKTVVHPKFLDGQETARGLPDEDRRLLFANFVTSKSDDWFAKAYVNRIWGALMGEGFYEPVDDLGPGREARFPMVINGLAAAWQASDYDMKWLFRLIMNTAAYQREIRPRSPSAAVTPFASVCPTRLSGDQIFNCLMTALGLDENTIARFGPQGPQARRFGAAGPRGFFNTQFGVDPSTPTDDVQGTVPQALFMMNSPLIGSQIRGEADTILGRLLAVYEDDEELVRLLYKRVLSRVPTANETKTCKGYIQEVNNRHEAFEDLLWSLVNSTEFITKR